MEEQINVMEATVTSIKWEMEMMKADTEKVKKQGQEYQHHNDNKTREESQFR